jgi:hypothetical protein
MISDFVPVFAVIGILIVVLGFTVVMRYINYKENLFLAEKGISRPELKSVAGAGVLRWGIIITSLGFALTLGLFFGNFRSSELYPLHLGPWMLAGFIPLFLGIGLILIYYLSRKE